MTAPTGSVDGGRPGLGVDAEAVAGLGVDRRQAGIWLGFLGVVAAFVVSQVLRDTVGPMRQAIALGAVVALAVMYAAWRRAGRPRGDRLGPYFVVATLAILAVGLAGSRWTGYLLYGLCPIYFMVLRLWPALIAAVTGNLLPLGAAIAREGWSDRVVGHVLPETGVTIGLSIFLGTWIVRIITQSRERADLITALQASRAEVQRLSHATGVATERARLAGEIHDTLAQGFTSIITLLQAADSDDPRQALALRTARENLAESRALLAALAPPALGEGSLTQAVRRQLSAFTEQSSVPATFRLVGEPRPLPTAVEVVLLRAAQEALTNVRRHAAANEVAVSLAFHEGSVRLVVRDDGGGFDPATAAGFGLTGMRARAEQVDGVLHVRSDPDTGTAIELEVPA